MSKYHYFVYQKMYRYLIQTFDSNLINYYISREGNERVKKHCQQQKLEIVNNQPLRHSRKDSTIRFYFWSEIKTLYIYNISTFTSLCNLSGGFNICGSQKKIEFVHIWLHFQHILHKNCKIKI